MKMFKMQLGFKLVLRTCIFAKLGEGYARSIVSVLGNSPKLEVIVIPYWDLVQL